MLTTTKHPDFLRKCQIQLIFKVQWQISNLILEFKCTHIIGIIFNGIRFGRIFFTIKRFFPQCVKYEAHIIEIHHNSHLIVWSIFNLLDHHFLTWVTLITFSTWFIFSFVGKFCEFWHHMWLKNLLKKSLSCIYSPN